MTTDRAEDLCGGEITGRELGALLSPMDPTAFLADYWQRRPLHLPGHPDKFRLLFDRRRFDAAILLASERKWGSFRLNAMRTGAQGHDVEALEPIAPTEVADVLARGISVCVNDIGQGDDLLAQVGRGVKASLGYTGSVRFNAYLSPDAAGAGMHFDARVATTLQIEGRKRWRFSSSPAVTWPRSNAVVDVDGLPRWVYPWIGGDPWERAALRPLHEFTFEEVTLEPGDVLCLPAGTWHSASAIGSSLALNLTFEPRPFSEFVQTLLDVQFRGVHEWRSGPPPFDLESSDLDTMPEAVKSYLRERLREAGSFLAEVERSDTALERLWRRFVVGAAAEQRASGAKDVSESAAVPEPSEELTVVHDRPISYFTYSDALGGPALCFLYGSLEIDVSGKPAVDFFRRLARTRHFIAATAIDWTEDGSVNEWPAVQRVLHVLMQRGILTRRGQDGVERAPCC